MVFFQIKVKCETWTRVWEFERLVPMKADMSKTKRSPDTSGLLMGEQQVIKSGWHSCPLHPFNPEFSACFSAAGCLC